MKFTIQGRLPNLNDYIDACRSNKYGANNFKKQCEKSIIEAIRQAKIERVTTYPITLKITWYELDLRRDIDNITFAVKFIQDALVKAKILKDDSQKHIDKLIHDVKKDKDNPRIEVEICMREF